MSSHIQLSIKMFGAFRQYHPGTLTIDIAEGGSVAEVKSAISLALRSANPLFHDDDLINKSAIANHYRVFKEDDRIIESGSLAILPPVCGG